MKRILSIALVFALAFAAVAQKQTQVQKLKDGMVVFPRKASGNVRQVRLQVISETVIKVSATAQDKFADVPSLMVLAQKPFSSFKVGQDQSVAFVTTGRLQARVSLETGEVTFLDASGKVLLAEQPGGGKELTKNSDSSVGGYKLKQRFTSPADEAFYGLGGHQNGQMNYKGEDVELAQHNIVDIIPFVYSTKNYGLLWDNYSISHFGDDREYQPLSSLQLFDKNGLPGGLTASYYVSDQLVRSATENAINFEYLETPEVDHFPKDIAEKGKIVWEGSFASDQEGLHKFLVYASGYFKVWVDGKMIMDKWRQNWNPWTNKFKVAVAKDEKHTLKIEWIPQGGYLAVKHLDPFDVSAQSDLTLSSEVGDEIIYYFVHGKTADDVIKGYRSLTGKAPIAPSWAMGFWQSRERYRNQQELIDVVKEYRKRQIPLDNIVMDWQYWEDPKWGSHEFDASRFPNPKGMVDTLHKLHSNLMISVWPKFNKGTTHYDEMDKNGFLFKRNIEKHRKDWVGIGYESTFYDPFNPAAGKLFWKQMDEKLNKLGIDAWWLDATEPDIHSNLSIEERKLNMSPTALGSGARYFNAYSLMNAKSVYEGQRQSSPEKRVFILTRSAFGGQQRYGATTWSGDIVSRWSDFQDQIATGINFSLSGIPYWTMDIGGFAVESRYYNATGETLDEWRELNARWFQFGAFCPVFRSHGQFPLREIYNIAPEGHEVYNTMVYYTKLRYRLTPYIYSLAGHAYHDDQTIMRGLVMDFPGDVNVRGVGNQYMFGPSLMVNPVYEYKARTREVYLPAGNGWYDLSSGKHHDGGKKITVEAPLGQIPVMVRSGAILPVGPPLQYVSEKPADKVRLYVYTGANGNFKLYEDEGVNYDYEKGAFSTIPFSYDEQTKSLTIGKRAGQFRNMLSRRVFEVVWVTPTKTANLDQDAPADATIEYKGDAVTIRMK